MSLILASTALLALVGTAQVLIDLDDCVIDLHDCESFRAGGSKPQVMKHVLWPSSQPPPSLENYGAWYNSSNVTFVGHGGFPKVQADAHVDIFFLTKPVFSLVGQLTAIWHSGLGFRVADGPSYVFEFTSLDFMAAIAFPDKSQSSPAGALHFPSRAIVDYCTDSSGESFPVAGSAWKEVSSIGESSGEALNQFFEWSLTYATEHPRYLVWRLLEETTERTLIDSQQCFDYVFRGLRFLRNTGASINVTELPRTMVDMYASSVDELPFNGTIDDFFASKRKVLAEWLQLSGEVHVPFEGQKDSWYWPAWWDLTPYAGGTSSIIQDEEYPQRYHRYNLAWPKNRGVHRTPYAIFGDGQEATLSDSAVLV